MTVVRCPKPHRFTLVWMAVQWRKGVLAALR
jgi:hypothetical protein